MMKHVKRLCVIGLLCLLSACGGGEASQTQNPSSSTVTTQPVTTADTTVVDSSSGTQTSGSSTGTTSTGASSGSTDTMTSGTATTVTTPPLVVTQTTATLKNPIAFVTQVPAKASSDFGARLSTFANHRADVGTVPRGGDLMIRYPDGTLRNLTKEAGYTYDGALGSSAVAVREPSVNWDGTKLLFSMVVGSPSQNSAAEYHWQIYEATGLGKTDKVTITKVLGQPVEYNNISPFYGSDDSVMFTSDRPHNGNSTLYPQLDEYESTPTVTGIWKLTSSGSLRLMNHAISGAFNPFVDSFGRVIFTRWDHLQRDQQADADPASAINFASEVSLTKLAGVEVFPEPRSASTNAYGRVQGYTNNLFSPWEMNQDGTREQTINHIGRNEMQPGMIPGSFLDDPAIGDYFTTSYGLNKKVIRGDGGILQIKEDPKNPGWYYAIYGREFGEASASGIVRFPGARGMNPEQMAFTEVTDPNWSEGRFRTPTPLSDGQFVAVRSPSTSTGPMNSLVLRIEQLKLNSTTGMYGAGTALTGTGINKTVTWYDPYAKQSYSGLLWELDPVEIVARPKPTALVEGGLDSPEASVFTDAGASESEMRAWLKQNNYALVIIRNLTKRDRADIQQPYNLAVPGGVSTAKAGSKVYNITNFQMFQADLIRGYTGRTGRRPIAQPMHDTSGKYVEDKTIAGSVKIASDGSAAIVVPANRAMVWQSTDKDGVGIVKERDWITFQAGEVRTCAGCHGVNTTAQDGSGVPQNKPQALKEFLTYWKTIK